MPPDVRQIAQMLGGDVSGRNRVAVPGPGHSARDRSLSIKIDARAPAGFVTHSHSGDSWQTCRDYVRERLGLPPWQPGDDRDRRIPPSRIEGFDFSAISTEADEGPRPWTEGEIKRINMARAIWREAKDPRGTLAEDYLKTRALRLQDDVAGTMLRFHPECQWRNEDTGTIDRIPALLAAFRSIDNDGITSIHRIRLDQPERWPKVQRRMLGVMFRTAVKLGPVGDTLYVGEGVETCLAGRVLGYKPAWALGSTGLISSFPIIDDVKQLIIFAEAGEASARAIRFCSERWRKAGRVVRMVVPDDGCNDLNDELMMAKTK